MYKGEKKIQESSSTILKLPSKWWSWNALISFSYPSHLKSDDGAGFDFEARIWVDGLK